jgi:hypothetical protein
MQMGAEQMRELYVRALPAPELGTVNSATAAPAIRPSAPGTETKTMTRNQKIIRATLGFLERAKQIGDFSLACKMIGYSRDSFNELWCDSYRTPAACLT